MIIQEIVKKGIRKLIENEDTDNFKPDSLISLSKQLINFHYNY